ncbi:hypothetical protein BaRGS_00021463 [Batillaria attramentaria]|uniref:SAP domain-containing protein n=1 Tax=Batillaria attramentaria TaxID=370345 RepID=A0ABD0KJM1_9CAEN
MEMDAIRLRRVPVLQNFLRERGLKTTGSKEELVALVWACHVFGKEPVPSASETTKTLAKEYAALLVDFPTHLPSLKKGGKTNLPERSGHQPAMRTWRNFYSTVELTANAGDSFSLTTKKGRRTATLTVNGCRQSSIMR